MKMLVVLAALLGASLPAPADILILRDGQVVTGTVLRRDKEETLVQFEYGTATYPASMIKEFQAETNSAVGPLAQPGRIPAWSQIVSKLAQTTWAPDLRQVPAVVIEKGTFKNVPYMSFRSGYAYELNIYGDPDHPAGLEIGVQRYLAGNQAARSNCAAFVSSILPDENDKRRVAQLNWDKDLVTEKGLAFEITPPTVADADGGWWLSVYSRKELKQSQASTNELLQITEYKSSEPVQYQPLANSKSSKTAGVTNAATWRPDEYLGPAAPRRSRSPHHRVYVRSYHRQGGKYVKVVSQTKPKP